MEWKCKFCCGPAVWFCWGNTHFCDPCHKMAAGGRMPPCKPCDPATCDIKMPHAKPPSELCLGCSMCRLEKRSKL